jgi:toxin ParE1/3/4
MMRLRVSKSALHDLDSIYDYWAGRASQDVARDLIYAIVDRFSLLAETPNAGQSCEDLAPGVRRFPAGKYLIYYRRARRSIEILHVFHGARDQRGVFEQR